MNSTVLNRMVVAVGISAVAMLGLSLPSIAQPQKDHQQQHDQKKAKPEHAKKPPRLAPQDQDKRIDQNQKRVAQYRQHLDQQLRVAQKQTAQLQRQNRRAQYRLQQHYEARLRQQQLRVQRQDNYNYGRDPYFYTPATYEYSRGSRQYPTNQYGLNVLRQAVNFGYDDGVHAGLADRQDRSPSNYEDSFAYQDANYGYTGFYVDQDDYNYYFREGFRRGYGDGYDDRSQYGTRSGGKGSILDAVMGVILKFQAIR